ncbi:MAG: PEP-CTERM sorting domain-containing protein, partial [Thiobacillus sp.]|nr:PEP-CTERM sorting domain-containing protein [Thiobacillus sp.]
MLTIYRSALAAALLATAPGAGAYVIDANLADWGITRTGSANDWTPDARIKGWGVEDQTGGLGTYLRPGYGGQAYDVEALYVDFDSQYLYLALVTGHNPRTAQGGGHYAAGDFAIDFGRDGSFEYGIETTGSNGKTQGGLYAVRHWGAGLWGAANEGPTSVLAGVLLGLGEVAYSTTGVDNLGAYRNDLHYFYEARVPLNLFGPSWGQAFDVHWTMNCANDSLTVDPAPVPEPATLALLAAGALGLLRHVRKP